MPDLPDLPRHVAILGTGRVGRTLGARWAEAGIAITFGTRDPGGAGAQAATAAVPGARTIASATAVADADVVLIAVPAAAVVPLVAGLVAGALARKVVIDATNTFPGPPDEAPSAAIRLSRAAPDARVVKAFNTIGTEVMADPIVAGQPVELLIAGDDPAALAIVSDLARAVGFDPVVAGGLELSADLEGMARLWVTLAMRRGHGRRSAFRWLRERS